jgi:hypothetical protein
MTEERAREIVDYLVDAMSFPPGDTSRRWLAVQLADALEKYHREELLRGLDEPPVPDDALDIIRRYVGDDGPTLRGHHHSLLRQLHWLENHVGMLLKETACQEYWQQGYRAGVEAEKRRSGGHLDRRRPPRKRKST